MSDLLRSYLTIGIFLGVSVALVAAIMGLGSLVRPTRPQPEKYVNYESGVDPVGEGALAVRPTTAVLHRVAGAPDDGPTCGSTAVPSTIRL